MGSGKGAIAKTPIKTNEYILEIPIKLMMSQVNAFADPIIGPTLESKQDFVHGDSILAIYIIYEKNKLEDSFYYCLLYTSDAADE